ncbi:tRNA pseudouridine(13) synthase TruD [Candidatus Woesearchaeota archaeon]|nr:tRNA pseudouridine(13) synthase TruD [Candidatus Woesearchaeota archaeon]
MQLKYKNQDFFVKEILDINKFLEKDEKGCCYHYFILKKDGWNTFDILRKLADILDINLKDFGYAGNKDKDAVTEQYISIRTFSNPEQKLKSIKLKDVSFEYLGKGKKPISLGDLEGNFFDIVVRNLKKKYEEIKSFKNYYGDQRFGMDKNNIIIGRALLKKDYKTVTELLKLKPKYTDYIAALNEYDKRELKFYVSAFQSYLWNRLDKPLDVIGFDYEGEEYNNLLAGEGLTKKDFIFKELPFLSADSSKRVYQQEVQIETVNFAEDEFFPKSWKQEIRFFLPKGCYATVLVEQMFKD